MRKIRVFIIAPYSETLFNIKDVLMLEDYQVYHSENSVGMDIVQDVFMPEIVLTFGTSPVDRLHVLRYFGKHQKVPVIVLAKKQFSSDIKFLRNTPIHSVHFVLGYFGADAILVNIQNLIKPLQADIDWLDGDTANH